LASQINASNSGFGGVVTSGDSSGVLQLQTANTTAVTIDTSQNVGIGTTSPSAKLNVVQSGNGNIATFNNGTVSASIFTGGSAITFGDTAGNNQAYIVPGSNYYTIYTNGSERMRIDSSGNVLIGLNTNVLSSKILGNFSAASNTGIVLNETSGGSSTTFASFSVGSVAKGSITWNGTSVSYNNLSDYRLKENIAPMTSALYKVEQLKPVTYTWKESGLDGQGFIAHELQEIVPDCVTGEKDAVDDEGKPVYQGVDTSFLVATLTAAIQEQQTIINDLKARIETLESK